MTFGSLKLTSKLGVDTHLILAELPSHPCVILTLEHFSKGVRYQRTPMFCYTMYAEAFIVKKCLLLQNKLFKDTGTSNTGAFVGLHLIIACKFNLLLPSYNKFAVRLFYV
jgi:hypothetical protein